LQLGFRSTYQHFRGLGKLLFRWLCKKQEYIWSKAIKALGERIG